MTRRLSILKNKVEKCITIGWVPASVQRSATLRKVIAATRIYNDYYTTIYKYIITITILLKTLLSLSDQPLACPLPWNASNELIVRSL